MASISSSSTCAAPGENCYNFQSCGGFSYWQVKCSAPRCGITVFMCKRCWANTERCTRNSCGAFLTHYNAVVDSDAVLTLASTCSAVPDSLENAHVDWAGTPTPRWYQVQAANAAFQKNKIINLPTGTGKTLIAVMLIDWFRRQVPERLILFLVESVSLVCHQARVVRNHTTFRDMLVSEITSEEAEWTSEWWNDAKTHPHVLVCTAEVARKAMTDHAFLRPSDLSLVVFDEAHKSVCHDSYLKVARRIISETTSVRMVGFTASYLHGRLSDSEGMLQRLQSNLHAEIWLPSEDDIQPFLPQKHFARAIDTDPGVHERTSTPPEDPVPVEPSHTVQPDAGRAVGNVHSELQTHQTNPKSFLNDTLSGVLRQPLSPDDVVYASYPSPPNGFVSTVTLGGRRLMENALWREANVLDVPCRGEGQTKKMSEQKAAKVMIDLLQRKRLIATTQLFAQEQDLDALAPTVPDMEASSAASPARAWCAEHNLPEVLATALEGELVAHPIDLVGLSDDDLDLLAQGCRLGEKGRFKRLVREMRAGIVPAVGHG